MDICSCMEHPIIITSEGQVGPRFRGIFNKFSVLAQKVRDEIMAQEDAEIFKVLDSVFEIKYSNNKE